MRRSFNTTFGQDINDNRENEVRFQVGTDEYGNKIVEKAVENGFYRKTI